MKITVEITEKEKEMLAYLAEDGNVYPVDIANTMYEYADIFEAFLFKLAKEVEVIQNESV